MARVNAQRKGKVGELEVCKMLQDHGFDCRRTPNSGGLSFKGDIWGLRDHHFEVKRVERLDLPKAWRQATQDASVSQTPVLVHRRSNSEWLATVRAEDYLGLLEEVAQWRETERAVEAE